MALLPCVQRYQHLLSGCRESLPVPWGRATLAEARQRLDLAEVAFSAGVVGQGRELYAAAVAHGYEGVVAKHLASPYQPGRRTPAWRKIEPQAEQW